jgi:GT2 family glycosyltransferase
MKRVLVVLVLYRMRAEESPAFTSLREILSEDRVAGDALELMVCDNTPYEQSAPEGFSGVYVRDTANPGLAKNYNRALEAAKERGMEWLLLLDQDTTLTGSYVAEVCRETALLAKESPVVAFVPKLAERGVVCSPAEPPVWGPPRSTRAGVVGPSDTRLFAFNSGAVLRVPAVIAMGGFPEAFPLDYLDHATFSRLQARGGRLHLLRSVLEHELSSNTESQSAAAVRRQESVLDAERRFYAEYGTASERCLRRLRLLKAASGRMVRGKEWGQTWRMLKWAVRP